MMFHRLLARIAVLAIGSTLLAGQPAAAGSLNVWPVRVFLPSDGSPQNLQLSNPSANETLVQVEAVAWAEGEALKGAPLADEILAVPPVFELEPGGEQLVRLALRQPLQKPTEQAFRLLITEVPKTAGLPTNTLAIAIQLNLPVFATPDGATPDPVWSLRRAQGDGAELVVANRGTAHVRLRHLKLYADADADPMLTSDNATYVMPGKERSWPLDLSATQLDGPLTLKAETNIGPLETTVAWPEG